MQYIVRCAARFSSIMMTNSDDKRRGEAEARKKFGSRKDARKEARKQRYRGQKVEGDSRGDNVLSRAAAVESLGLVLPGMVSKLQHGSRHRKPPGLGPRESVQIPDRGRHAFEE